MTNKQIKVRTEERVQPQLRKLARALISLARQQAEAKQATQRSSSEEAA